MAVDPGDERFARQRTLAGFGPGAQTRLAAAHVVVIGAGGLGCTVLPGLAAAGVGAITIVDDDVVDTANLHRQTLYAPADVGRPKTDAAADALERLAPGVRVRRRPERFAASAAGALLRDADLLVDGSDDRGTRYRADDAAAAHGIPLVWGSALGWDGQVGIAWDERGVGYRDLYPQDDAAGADPSSGDGDAADEPDASCAVVGVLPSVCAVVGGLMVSEALKLLTGAGEPLLGRAVVYDARAGSLREVRYRREEGAARPRPLVFDEGAAPRAITAPQLATLLAGAARPDADEPAPVLLDVREPSEAASGSLPDAVRIPLAELPARIGELDPDAPTVVYCHHGVRSRRALGLLERAGFTRVRHLAGGIDAYAAQVDPALARY